MAYFFQMLIVLLAGVVTAMPAHAQTITGSVYLEDYTWPEIRDKLASNTRTIIIPLGGTEQNGPHLALGKHNAIVGFTSGEIARELGNALVAPVIAYVPEGRISPPEGHMKFPGTISVTEATLSALLEDAARSFKEHGFTIICFIGDHGGSQVVQQRVADRLSSEWRTESVQVLHVSDYYANNGQEKWLTEHQPKRKNPNGHAGFFDTSELLATDKRLVSEHFIREYGTDAYGTYGVAGNPAGADTITGAQLLQLKIKAAVRQIRSMARR